MKRIYLNIHYFFALAALLCFTSCFKFRGYYGTKSYDPVNRPVQAADVMLPEGYAIELVSSGLNFPSGLTFDDKGTVYIIEAGYSYGEIYTTPKLLRIEQNGKTTEIAHGG